MSRIARTDSATVTFSFAGETIEAHRGDSIAAALLAAGYTIFRATPVTGAPRGPLCMMGVCFECLVQVNGSGNQQACMLEVRQDMVVIPQDGAFDATSLTPNGDNT